MTEWKQWLLTSVAAECANKGFANINIYDIAEEDGISEESLTLHFIDEKELVQTLITEIANAHKHYILQATENMFSVRDRLVHFVVASIEYTEQNPVLGKVIINSLFSTDNEIVDHVYEVYTRLFELMIPYLEEEGIIARHTNTLISDLSTILLSVVFSGNCPQLIMEYHSWIDLHRVAESVIDALQKRYRDNNIDASFL